jgi:hypothetical protein
VATFDAVPPASTPAVETTTTSTAATAKAETIFREHGLVFHHTATQLRTPLDDPRI